MATTSPRQLLPTRLAAGAAGAFLLLGAAVAALVALASPAAATNHAVMIEQYAYSPAALAVDQGDTVTWTNHDSVQHDVTVTSGPATFHSPMLAQGQSWSFTFSTPGTYSYICSVHPDMKASVTAKATATAAPKTSKTKAAPVAPAAPATPSAAATTPKARAAGKASKAAAAAPAATEAAAPAATQTIAAVPAAASTASLDPLLLVAGASTAVMVFCLLLMTSRPVARPGVAPAELVAEPVVEPVED